MSRERTDDGRFEREVTDEELLAFFAEGRPFHTAREVADRFDVDRSTAYRRLTRLAESSALERVSLGSRTVVWWYRIDEHGASDEFDPDDPVFTAPTFTADDPVDETEIDEVLYDDHG
ncbi:MAG: helix-turn-helix domain-containing protein [Halobaculum sp.]